jgi:hypothetical protein
MTTGATERAGRPCRLSEGKPWVPFGGPQPRATGTGLLNFPSQMAGAESLRQARAVGTLAPAAFGAGGRP